MDQVSASNTMLMCNIPWPWPWPRRLAWHAHTDHLQQDILKPQTATQRSKTLQLLTLNQSVPPVDKWNTASTDCTISNIHYFPTQNLKTSYHSGGHISVNNTPQHLVSYHHLTTECYQDSLHRINNIHCLSTWDLRIMQALTIQQRLHSPPGNTC